MKPKLLLLASLLGLLSACSPLAAPTPTPLPPDFLPTAVALTGQAIFATANAATPTILPTVTTLPTETPIPSTPLPTATPTFEPGFTNFAQIRFLSPGPMSSLTSPINLQVILVSGRSEIVRVDLLGENGRILQRGLERVNRSLSGNYRSFKMAFEIRAVSEKGYIRISSKDDHGRLENLNTMPVLLYSVGDAQINPVGNLIYERCMLDGLKDGDEVSGGVVNLKGRFWPVNDSPVFVDMLLPDGTPITSRILNFNGIDPQPFETTLPYKVTEPTLVRLSFRQDNPTFDVPDPELGKLAYVYTQELLLNP
ncbi:MAG: hypothetical protein U0Z26_09970 [Anaerolineales bacterium]